MNHSPGRAGFLSLIICFTILQSCYSVRVVNRDGIPEPDPLNMTEGFYRGKKVHSLDTTINLKLTEGEFSLIERACSTRGFYAFEYRSTFGGLFLNAITLGRTRQLKIKYVCLKEEN
jgi:hypothetical protein